MYKCIALLRRRADITHEEFVDYYENKHSVLMASLFPTFLKYRRNYVDRDGAYMYWDASPLDFDVITELWFKDRAAYDEMATKAAQPEIAKLIAEDEENLFDRGHTRMFVVDEMGANEPEHG